MEAPLAVAYIALVGTLVTFMGTVINSILIHRRSRERDNVDKELAQLKHDLDIILKKEEQEMKIRGADREKSLEAAMLVSSRLFNDSSDVMQIILKISVASSRFFNSLKDDDVQQADVYLDEIQNALLPLANDTSQSIRDYYGGGFIKDVTRLNVDSSIHQIPAKVFKCYSRIMYKAAVVIEECDKAVTRKGKMEDIEEQRTNVKNTEKEMIAESKELIRLAQEWKQYLISRVV